MSSARSGPALHGADLRRLVQKPAHLRREEARAHQLVQGLLREEGPSRHSQADRSHRGLITIFPASCFVFVLVPAIK